MGLFGFGKKKRNKEEELEAEQNAKLTGEEAQAEAQQIADEVSENTTSVEEDAEETARRDNAQAEKESEPLPTEASMEYEGRGEKYGPWDIDEETAPDYDDYLSLGAYYLPFMQGIELRVKASRSSGQVLGTTITFGASSLEIEAFAAPKTFGLWGDVREDLLQGNKDAKEQPGIFGAELLLPVTLKNGKTTMTRIVGVDGPRWMLRGIFSGKAANNPDDPETQALNRFFSEIVVDRGEEPLAPRDLIPMIAPLTPGERRAQAAASEEDSDGKKNGEIPGKPKGPLSQDQEVETKTTLSRGPMFSEVR